MPRRAACWSRWARISDRVTATPLLWLGSAATATAILLLRLAWGRKTRSTPLNAGAWALLLLGVLLGARAAGAWGIAIVSLVATGASFLLLAHAGLCAPVGKPAAAPRLRHAPDSPKRIGGRLLTFLLAVPGAMFAAFVLALATRAIHGSLGASDSNGNVLAMFVMPLAWMLIVTLLTMEPRRTRQAALVAMPALAGIAVLLLAGVRI